MLVYNVKRVSWLIKPDGTHIKLTKDYYNESILSKIVKDKIKIADNLQFEEPIFINRHIVVDTSAITALRGGFSTLQIFAYGRWWPVSRRRNREIRALLKKLNIEVHVRSKIAKIWTIDGVKYIGLKEAIKATGLSNSTIKSFSINYVFNRSLYNEKLSTKEHIKML